MVLLSELEVLLSDEFHVDIIALLSVLNLQNPQVVDYLALKCYWQVANVGDQPSILILLCTERSHLLSRAKCTSGDWYEDSARYYRDIYQPS